MNDSDNYQEYEEEPPYQPLSAIDTSALRKALCKLALLGDDPFLRMQALNLAIVDQFLTELEYKTLHKLVDEERTPLPQAVFLGAQSQMWIFAAYELMRTWRQRARDMTKWAETGGLKQKLAALEQDQGYQHFGRIYRAEQIRVVLADPGRVTAIKRDLKRTHISFTRLEAIRISLAKHEVWKKKNSVALDPGYGRINSWCGALDYEIESDGNCMGYINRRDIADDIRALLSDDYIPSDEDIASFDKSMRGPPGPPSD